MGPGVCERMAMQETAAPTWDDARVEELKRLHSEGHSASRIAQMLGLASRNIVCGKLHRLGLSKERAAPAERPVQTPREPAAPPIPAPRTLEIKAAAPAPRQERPVTAPAPEPVNTPSLRLVTIDDLGSDMCRWPVGDPSRSDFRYCGGSAPAGRPYCQHHAAMAYEPERRRPSQGVRR